MGQGLLAQGTQTLSLVLTPTKPTDAARTLGGHCMEHSCPEPYLIREYWVLMSAGPRQSSLWGDSRRGGEATSGPLHVLFINIWMTKILANFRKTFIFCRNNAPVLSWREKHHINLGRENRRRCPLERQLGGVRQPWAWSHLLQIPVQTQSLKSCVALEK